MDVMIRMKNINKLINIIYIIINMFIYNICIFFGKLKKLKISIYNFLVFIFLKVIPSTAFSLKKFSSFSK